MNYSNKFTYRNPITKQENKLAAQTIILSTVNVLKNNYNTTKEIEVIKEKIQQLEKEIVEAEDELVDVENAIIKAQSNQADILGEMHVRAENDGKFLYVIILAIMFFEVIILLFLYYKRLFMIAILIAIFPLITVAYVFEKSRGEKAKIFQTWLQEYTLNVFIQTIHAILYVTLVEVGYAVYIDNHDNVIIFIVAVSALISAEPIFKNILGLKGSTVSDLAKHSATMGKTLVAAGALTSTFLSTRADLKNIEKKDSKKAEKAKTKDEKHDKREDTLRRANENRINKNNKLTDEEKQKKIDNWNKAYSTTDKIKEDARKKRETIRRHWTRAKQMNRVNANATAFLGTIAGGIAAGGDLDDFTTASKIANAITGTGQNLGKDDAAKVKVDNNVKNVSTENDNTPNGYKPKYNGSGYEGFSIDSGGNGAGYGNGRNSYRGSNGSGIEDNDNYPEKNEPKVQPKLRGPIAKRLEQEKVYVDKKYTERQENK